VRVQANSLEGSCIVARVSERFFKGTATMEFLPDHDSRTCAENNTQWNRRDATRRDAALRDARGCGWLVARTSLTRCWQTRPTCAWCKRALLFRYFPIAPFRWLISSLTILRYYLIAKENSSETEIRFYRGIV